jgi:transcriptional regulator with XRE-family HTH domain
MILMTSLQISISPSKRAAGRFVSRVRRAIQKAMAEENDKRGLTQSDVARALGVHRSVISREINGFADLTLSRAAELAWALGRKPSFDLLEPVAIQNTNLPQSHPP